MIQTVRKVVVRTGLVIAAVLIAYSGWRWGSAVFPRAEAMLGIDRPEETAPDPTPEIAARAGERIDAFMDGEEDELRLDGVEVSAVLRHTIPGMIPDGVSRPLVILRDDRLEFHGQVVPEKMPQLPDLGPALGILPDTVPVEVAGTLMPFGERGSVFLVSRMQAKGVPLPRRVFREVLASLGREEKRGLPPEGIPVPVPDGLQGAYIEDGQLVLIRR